MPETPLDLDWRGVPVYSKLIHHKNKKSTNHEVSYCPACP